MDFQKHFLGNMKANVSNLKKTVFRREGKTFHGEFKTNVYLL